MNEGICVPQGPGLNHRQKMSNLGPWPRCSRSPCLLWESLGPLLRALSRLDTPEASAQGLQGPVSQTTGARPRSQVASSSACPRRPLPAPPHAGDPKPKPQLFQLRFLKAKGKARSRAQRAVVRPRLGLSARRACRCAAQCRRPPAQTQAQRAHSHTRSHTGSARGAVTRWGGPSERH